MSKWGHLGEARIMNLKQIIQCTLARLSWVGNININIVEYSATLDIGNVKTIICPQPCLTLNVFWIFFLQEYPWIKTTILKRKYVSKIIFCPNFFYFLLSSHYWCWCKQCSQYLSTGTLCQLVKNQPNKQLTTTKHGENIGQPS